jgi:hypothetical protein
MLPRSQSAYRNSSIMKSRLWVGLKFNSFFKRNISELSVAILTAVGYDLGLITLCRSLPPVSLPMGSPGHRQAGAARAREWRCEDYKPLAVNWTERPMMFI